MPKGFDPRCQELADVFLPTCSTKEQSDELAQLIQDTIEDHLNYGMVSDKLALFPVGTRVTFSAHGRAFRHRRVNPNRLGTVVAKSYTADCVGVHWDGNAPNSRNAYHVDLLAVAGVHSPSVADESDRTRTSLSEITRANSEDGERPQ